MGQLLEYVFEMLFSIFIDCRNKFALFNPEEKVAYNIFFT